MRSILRAAMLGIALLVPAVASAQGPAPRPDPARSRARAVAPPPAPLRDGRQLDGRTVYDFPDADEIIGSGAAGDGGPVIVRRRARRHTLIRVRENFIPEALKSVERF